MRPVITQLTTVAQGIVVDGEGEARLLMEETLRDLAARAADVARRVLTGAPSAGAEIRPLGSAVVRDAFAPDARDLERGGTCFYLRPKRPLESWLRAEPIAWETAIDQAGRFLVQSGHLVVRAVGDQAVPCLRLGERDLKLLVVCANPKGSTFASMDVAAARQALQPALSGCVCEPHVQVVEGAGTLARLRAVLSRDKQWDVVHVIAHASRAGQGTICLEGETGHEDHQDIHRFALTLREIKDARLVTLAACSSSPLAVHLACGLPGSRVVGFLHDARQQTMCRFFETFYRELLQPQGAADDGAEVLAEEAFRRAVVTLEEERNPEWFLPVLYAPASLTPLIHLGVEHDLREIAALIQSGLYQQAAQRAGGLLASPSPTVRRRAEHLRWSSECLEAFRANLGSFEAELQRAALSDDEDWSQIDRRWRERDFSVAPTAGAVAVADLQSLLQGDARFAQIYQALQRVKDIGLDAVRRLSSFQSRVVEAQAQVLADLHQGCECLLSFARERGNTSLCDLTPAVFERGVARLVARATDALRSVEGESDPRARAAAVRHGLGLLVEVRRLIEEAQPSLAAPALLTHVGETIEAQNRAAARVLAADRPAAPDPAILAPGARVALCRWLAQETPGAALDSAERPTLSVEQLLAAADSLARSAEGGSGRAHLRPLSPTFVSLLANEAAPIVLATDLESALHPYLCLAALNVRPDTSAREVRAEAEFRVGDQADPAVRALMQAKIPGVTDLRRRLLLDAHLLPCHDVERCTTWIQQAAEAFIRDGVLPPDPPAGIHPLDRFTLLAVSGRASAAAAEAWDHAARNPGEDQAIRGAVLLAVHEARLSVDNPDRFSRALRHAMAALGILVATPDLLERWMARRFAVYQEVVPPDSKDLLQAVRNELRNLVDLALVALAQHHTSSGELAQVLGAELQAELAAAEHPARSKLRGSVRAPQGGYHAARLTGQLDALGGTLARTFRTLRAFTDDQYFPWVTISGISRESFHELVLLFSALRTAHVSSGEQALGLLGAVVAPGDELSSAQTLPGVRRLLEAPTAALDYPVAAALPPDDAATLLAWQGAVLAIRSHLELAQRELTSPARRHVAVVRELDTVIDLAHHVAVLEYPIPDAKLDPMGGLDTLCCSWAEAVSEREPDATDQAAGAQRLRAELTDACRLAETLNAKYRPPRFQTARAKLHLRCAVFVANAFDDWSTALSHLRIARQANAAEPVVVTNIVRACKMALRAGAGTAVLNEALADVARFLASSPPRAYPALEQELEEYRAMVDVSRREMPARVPLMPRLVDEDKERN